MNHLKKIFFALAVVAALGVYGTSSAYAQIQCTAFSVPTLIRATGVTELAGNVLLSTCTGTFPALVAAASITVTISPPTAVITNDLAAGKAPTITLAGAAGGAAVTNGGQGTISGNTVTFGITGTAGAATFTSVTISNIRVNANASGVVFPAQIAALVTSSPPTAIAITNNQLNVAIPQNAAIFAIGAGAGIPQCSSATFAGSSDAPSTIAITPVPSAGTFTTAALTLSGKTIKGGTTATVTVTEGFPSSFHKTADEGLFATQGTRIVINLAALPSNIVLYAPEFLSADALGTAGVLNLTLVSNAGSDGNGGALSGGAAGTADLITGTSVTYEVTADDDANATGLVIPIQLYTTGTAAPTGTVTMTAAVGPTTGPATAATGAPIPRFGGSPASGTATSVIPCVTNILFPWVANVAGYDTGFAVANTTSDTFGTSSQSGTCIYNFYGTNPPSGGTFTTKAFGGGAVDTELLSAIAPGFSGYVIIQCNFQLGHAFDFISNGFGGGAVTVGQGGIGLIILQPGTTGSTSRKSLAAIGPPFGEALGH